MLQNGFEKHWKFFVKFGLVGIGASFCNIDFRSSLFLFVYG